MQKQNSSKPSTKYGVRDMFRDLRQYRAHKADINRLIEEFYIALDTPVSLSCYLLFRYQEFDQLVCREVHPIHYLDGESFRSDLAAISFLRKNRSLKTSFNRKQIAIASFYESEKQCQDTNRRLIEYQGVQMLQDKPCAEVLKRAKRKIYSILKRFDVDEFLDLCTWGPGSTLSVTGESVSHSHKFDIEKQMTRDAHDLFHNILSKWNPRWEAIREVEYVVGSKVATVPKNAKIDRTIAIEPGLNSWCQLGVGKLIRRRLRAAGYDLNSDRKNQDLARKGSIDGSVATLDFRAASDTISYETVRLLLPDQWFHVTDAIRSHYYRFGTTQGYFEKFSSMGNGFTFELESLIFLAVGLATCEYLGVDDSDVSIFGDDLILPKEAVLLATEVCSDLGFTLNVDKSFWSTPFRESCGAYYFSGLDVKPFYLKGHPQRVKDLYRFANSVRRLADIWGDPLGADRRFQKLWLAAVEMIPPRLRLFGPSLSGDATIHVSLDEIQVARAPGQIEGFYYSGLPEVPLHEVRDSYGVLLAKLFRPSSESQGNEIPKRARTRMIFKKRMLARQWCTPRPWC